MKTTSLLMACALAGTFSVSTLSAADLVKAKDGSGYYGYDDTPVLPWCGFRVHDANRPAPKRVTPGTAGQSVQPATPPADAVVLFDGKDLSKWSKPSYKIVDGELEASGGDNLTTIDSFGDCQIHLEWKAPSPEGLPWYNRGNNGLFIMSRFEIQIFDSYTEKIYPDGMAAAVYGQTPPLVNVCLPPGQWQTYDIAFTAPVFTDGKLTKPAHITMFHNGVLVQLNQEIYGETGHRILPEYKNKTSKGPLSLGGHNCPVRFRNIWVRPL
jgi:hypothetical protein